MNKQKLRINCDLCDARNIKEEAYQEYQDITICADTIVTNDRSKEILSRLPDDGERHCEDSAAYRGAAS